MGLLGILVALSLLIWLAYRGWSVLLLAPAAAIIAAGLSGDPLLAHWTQTFMASGAQFVMQFFPIFLLGALFGKLMEDSSSVSAIATFMTKSLGAKRAVLAVVLAGAVVTYGGVSLFVAFFVLAPMAHALFRAAEVPKRLMPAAIALGTSTFTMSMLPGTPAIQNAIPMPFFGTTPFAAPGLGVIASVITLGFGLWWLSFAESRARRKGEGYGADVDLMDSAKDEIVRERATTSGAFDPAEIVHGDQSQAAPPIALAVLPLFVVVAVNLLMSLFILPRIDASYLYDPAWGSTTLSAVGGVWAVVTALAAAIAVLIAINFSRLPTLRATMDAGANASALPALSVARPGRLRRRRRGAAGIRAGARLGARHRGRSTGFAGGGDERARLAYRVGVRRPHHRARLAGRRLYEDRRRARDQPGPFASRGGDRRRHA